MSTAARHNSRMKTSPDKIANGHAPLSVITTEIIQTTFRGCEV
jgi:hypothetical protein